MVNWRQIRAALTKGSSKIGLTQRHAAVNATAATGAASDAVLFFEELASLATGTGRIVPAAPSSALNTNLHLWNATVYPDKRVPDAERWWDEASRDLLRRFPDADRYALDWLCDIPGRHAQVARLRGLGAIRYGDSSPDWLKLWVLRRPLPERAERIETALTEALLAAIQGAAPWATGPTGEAERTRAKHAFDDLVRFLDRVCDDGDDFLQRAGRLVGRTLACPSGGQSVQGMVEHLLGAFVPPLWRAGRLSPEDQTQALLRHPGLARNLEYAGSPPAGRQQLHEIVQSLIARAAAEGTIDRPAQEVASGFSSYAGFADFAAAVRWLDRPAGAKNDAWAVHVLRRLPPPGPEDVAALEAFADVKADTLCVACVFAPSWATTVERAVPVKETDGLAGFAAWPRPYLGASPWALDYDGNRAVEWDPGAIPGERAGLADTIERMGEERVRKLLAHPLLRKYAKTAGFCLAAILGENAADVEVRFLKRDKWAVVALGMLPDEGDVQDRYLALRRFAQEAQKSGPQRGASEAVAVQIALAHLAVTGGYDDVKALEWAIETALAAGVDPAARRWTAAGYDLWVEPSDAAPIRVERGGKSLKSVPAVVRRTAEYAEAKEARDLLLAQTERVRRRLERAMVRGERLDRAACDQLLALPAGRLLLPRLVLLARLPDTADPVEIAGDRTLAGELVALAGATEVRIAHPLDLAVSGTLAGWQRRIVQDGIVQPFNQLFRGVYLPTAGERASQICHRFRGRKVTLGALRRALLRAGWEAPSYYAGFVRRFGPSVVAELGLEDWVTFGAANAPVTLGELGFHGRNRHDRLPALDALWFAEAVREVELATAPASSLPPDQMLSTEQMAVRGDLVRAFVPEAIVTGEIARLPGGGVHLATGAAYDGAGNPILLPELVIPAAFPYPTPEPAAADVLARALHLAARS